MDPAARLELLAVRIWVAALVLVVVVTAAITLKLLVRRRASVGGWFADSPRSAGTLSVIGTMFAVMLAFVILVALQSYQRAREGASVEAIAVAELHSVAGVFESPVSDRVRGELVCYGRAVVEDEWPAMRQGRSSDLVQSWIDKLGQESAIAEPNGVREETAYAQWFDEKAQRRDGRRERLAEAAPVVTLPLWFVLCLGASLTLAYMVAQADRREGLFIQSIPIGFVSALATAGLLVVFFLDHPYTSESGSIAPTEMRRTLTLIDHGSTTLCNERGIPHSP
jgi:Protein of unknown function (DUF4239)